MKISVTSGDIEKTDTDLIALFTSAKKDGKGFILPEEALHIDKLLNGVLSEAAKAEDFEAQKGQAFFLHTHGKIPAKKILLVGLGNIAEFTHEDLLIAVATIGKKGQAVSAKSIAIAVPPEVMRRFGSEQTGQAVAEGIILGTYVFHKHKSEASRKKDKLIEKISLVTGEDAIKSLSEGARRGEVVGKAVVFARDLVNEPPSITTPTYLAGVAKSLTKNNSVINCEVFSKKEMAELGMNALLAIARGSDEEPKFIKLEYSGQGKKTIVLVGKGITFDAGGLSLKNPKNMETMKLDMSGAAAILAVFKVLSIIRPNIHVIGLISATENMPGPRAIKPGDIVRAMNGKTIEILNTDAEGRVILADALSYATTKLKPDTVIDLATLTGACVVALGEDVAGVFANDKKLAQSLMDAARTSGEKLWELPLVPEYKELMKSTVADMRNVGSTPYGGAITGALFLEEFVSDSIPWAHLDIAGPAFAEKESPLNPPGGTGYGVRLLLSYLTKPGI